MDYSMFYMIGFIIFVVGLTTLIIVLRNKKILQSEDVLLVAKIFDLSVAIIDEMNLASEKKILSIADIVSDSIEFVISINDNPETMNEDAYNYAISLCEKAEIKLNTGRENIIKNLIDIGLTNKFAH